MRARVRPGHHLTVIDVSPGGALVEVARPLRPGTHVDVHMETDAQGGLVSARVLRCAVAAIHSEAGITYRAALAFVGACDWVREALSAAGYAVHAPLPGTASLSNVDELPRLQDDLLDV